MFALLDGNNFYSSCENAMQPRLNGRPLIVMGNNDGCTIARSNEARALGIKMGQPWFEIRHLEVTKGLVALSPNFALYGDMSDRMMSIAAELGGEQHCYSIDEAFSKMTGIRGDLKARSFRVRDRIKKWIGISTCVGLGHTATLAKFANHVAKDAERKPGSFPAVHAQVCDLSTLNRSEIDALLALAPVGDVWGVGRRIGAQLAELGIVTALDLARMDANVARARWSVVLERTVRELQGVSCMSMEDAPGPRQQIACTRSFGRPVRDLEPLCEAISEFASRAAEKLRRQGSYTGQVLVFIRTSPFRDGPQYSRSVCVPMRRPCADTRSIVTAALAGLRSIYQPGYLFAKAGVMLLELQPAGREQFELDLEPDPGARSRDRLMQAMDAINDRWGKGTMKIGTAPMDAGTREWSMRQERRTPCYTTDWSAIPIALA